MDKFAISVCILNFITLAHSNNRCFRASQSNEVSGKNWQYDKVHWRNLQTGISKNKAQKIHQINTGKLLIIVLTLTQQQPFPDVTQAQFQ